MKDITSKGKLIMVMGPPASGKSTLAAEVHTELKKRGINSAFVTEAATDYIAEYGVPNSPSDQMVIFYKQLNFFINLIQYFFANIKSMFFFI